MQVTFGSSALVSMMNVSHLFAYNSRFHLQQSHHKLVFLHGADIANITREHHENHLVFYDQNVQLLDNILFFLRCNTTLLMSLNKFAFLSKFFETNFIII